MEFSFYFLPRQNNIWYFLFRAMLSRLPLYKKLYMSTRGATVLPSVLYGFNNLALIVSRRF
jgi:hypothetical protein